MILTLAFRSLLSRPVRSAVLIGGFGLGVAVMTVLLGVGAVILDQARAPALRGGGDVVIAGPSGRLSSAQFILSTVLRTGSMAQQVAAAAPFDRADLFLIQDGSVTAVRVRGGIPSLERALKDPETSGVSAWTDEPGDRTWVSPDAQDVLRQLDRFHSVPDVPARASSWAEWLYFNGRAGDERFYLTFLAGPLRPGGKRLLGVRLQLDRAGVMTTYSQAAEVDDADLLAGAPDVAVGGNHVRLVDGAYQIALDLPAESERAGGERPRPARDAGEKRVRGALVLRGDPGRSLLPLVIRGSGGWLSGYVVPVMSGTLTGSLELAGRHIDFDGGAGYHDHNWGFWGGVSWQWGQVQHDGISLVYGRLHPPADAADASRVPGFLMALGPDGPIGFATSVTIEETNRPGTAQPERIVVRGRGESLDVTMELSVQETTVTTTGQGPQGPFDNALDFFQLRAGYKVSGHAGQKPLDFSAPGSAETFRGRDTP